jgi:uncharacterized protein YbaR (Trm112 family)
MTETKTDGRMLEALVCPMTGSALDYDAQNQELVSLRGKCAYPIRNGVPVLLPSEARVLDD